MSSMRIRGRVLRGGLCAAAVAVLVASATAVQANDTTGATFVAHFAPAVPPDARIAVEFAMSIWSPRIDSSVPIDVDVQWGAGLPAGVASSAEPVVYEPVADGSLQPVALANAQRGRDLEPGVSDIRLLLGSEIGWYTGVDGAAGRNATDMVTMALHELAHGLGFANSFGLDGGGLTWGRNGVPVGLDAHLSDASTGPLVAASSPSDLLASATSKRTVWNGAARDGHGRAPIFYAPARYEPGSSLSHLDDVAYPQGDPDALMTSVIRRGEVIHRIGPAALGVLHDLGWGVHFETGAPARAALAPPRSVPAAAPAAAPESPAPPAPEPRAAPTLLAARQDAVPKDFGRTGVTGIGAGIPLVAVAFMWRMRRQRRVPSAV